jgi:hypothetical protein
MEGAVMKGIVCSICGNPNCPGDCGEPYTRPVAGLALIVLVCALSGLLLVAKGSPGYWDPTTVNGPQAAEVAAQTVPIPMPQVTR